MKDILGKREYKYMYLSSLSYNFANALIETFGTVLLYKNGIPIYMILLIYAFRFLITGFCTPLFLSISSRFGIAKCILLSNIFSIFSAYMMINSIELFKNIILFMINMGLMGLSNPSSDALSSRYVDNNYRGRFNSILNITKVISLMIASCLVAWGVITNNNFILFLMVTLFYFLQYVFIKQIDYKPKNNKGAFTSTLKYIVISKSKYKNIYSLRTSHIIERLFVPLYLYIALNSFKAFSLVITISMLFQIITLLLIGKYTDKNIYKSNSFVTIIKIIITSIYLFAKNKFAISLNKTVSDNFDKLYETSIQTSIQDVIKNSKENSDLLVSVGQMSLCFTEVIVLGLLSVLGYFIGVKIFIIIFVLSIVSSLLIKININKELQLEDK